MSVRRSNAVEAFRAPSDPNHPINRRRRRSEKERGARPAPRARRGAGSGGGRGGPPRRPRTAAGSPRRPFRSAFDAAKEVVRDAKRDGNLDRAARRLRRLAPLLRATQLLDLIDMMDQLLRDGGFAWNKFAPPRLPGNYRWCKGPLWPWPSPQAAFVLDDPHFTNNGSCSVNPPLSGQAVTSADRAHWRLQYARQYWLQRYRQNGTGLERCVILGTAERIATGPVRHAQQPIWQVAPDLAIDPNFQRWLPGFAEPLPDVHPDEGTDLVPQMETRLGTRNAPVIAPEPAPMPRQRQHYRGVTDSAVRERKALSRSAKLGILLAKWVDNASEAAEVVDAVYEALPDDVRKAWEKKQGAHWVRDKKTGKWKWYVPSRPGDQYGQYGVDGADWKLRAIWYNYDKIDVEAALINIAKNHLSDSVIGRIKRGLPRQTGAALEDADKAFAKWLDKVLSWALEQV